MTAIAQPLDDDSPGALLVRQEREIDPAESARATMLTVLQWFRIEWCAAGRGVSLPNILDDVVASDKGQELLEGCTIGLNAWTWRAVGLAAEVCRPYNFSIPQQRVTLAANTGIVWRFVARDERSMTACGVSWTDEPRRGGVPRSAELRYAVGFEQRDDGLIWVSIDQGWAYDGDNASHTLIHMFRIGMLVVL